MNHLGGCYRKEVENGSYVPIVWNKIIELYGIKSVIDIGCGYAQSLKYFLDKGVFGVGIDGWEEAIEDTYSKGYVIKHDYTKCEYFANFIFDLGWSCEFVEHVEEKYIDNFMSTFKMCKFVAMTHAVPGQGGHHHVNCRDAAYWIDVFRKDSFKYIENDSILLRQLLYKKDGQPENFGKYVRETLMLFKKETL